MKNKKRIAIKTEEGKTMGNLELLIDQDIKFLILCETGLFIDQNEEPVYFTKDNGGYRAFTRSINNYERPDDEMSDGEIYQETLS